MTPKLATIACTLASTAVADQAPVPMNYELFETAVAHTDLETCPLNLSQSGVFCRATLHHDEVHVFAFSEEGDQALVGFASYPFEDVAAELN